LGRIGQRKPGHHHREDLVPPHGGNFQAVEAQRKGDRQQPGQDEAVRETLSASRIKLACYNEIVL
ncbi:hypothetical protein, partial [Solidesulfovibrio sp.]|uniref:hypothetical protein n=1 Tax=Solidesulfovibrio sp. TaxID=2910990 RepID=UPI002B1FA4D6